MEGIITKLRSDVEAAISPLFKQLEDLGVIHIGHGIIRDNYVPTAIYNNEAWAQKYRQEHYYRCDPLRLYALQTEFKLISWDSLLIENKKERKILTDRKKMCAVTQGFLFSIKDSTMIETLALGTDAKRTNLLDIISNSDCRRCLNEISYKHKTLYAH